MNLTKQRNRLRALFEFHSERANALQLALELLNETDQTEAPRAGRVLRVAAALDEERRAAKAPHKPGRPKKHAPGTKGKVSREAQRERITTIQSLFDLHEPRERPSDLNPTAVAQLIRHGYLKKAPRGGFLRTAKEPA